MKLIAITPENTVPEEASLANQLFQLGLDRLHLRKKDFGSDQYHAYLQQIDPEYHLRIAVHEQFDLIAWYLAHTQWLERVRTGEYLRFLKVQYGGAVA